MSAYKWLDEDSDEANSFWSAYASDFGTTVGDYLDIDYGYDPVFGIKDFVSDAGIRSDIYESPTDAQYASFLGDDPISLIGDDYKIGDREPSAAAKTRDLFGIGETGTKLLKAIGAKVKGDRSDRFNTPRAGARGGMPRGSSGGAGQVASLRAGKAGQDAARLAAGSGSSYLSKAMESYYKGNRVTNNSIASLFQEYLSATGSSGGKAGVTTALNPALRQIAIKKTA